jgi:septin family protein
MSATETAEALDRAATGLADAGAPGSVIEGLRTLRAQVGQPCVVAVVGLVNAGKTTFLNALLGEDKGIVGSTETTATINHFVFGRPDPARPVRCVWRGGCVTEETEAFVASLQGNDREVLERAEGLDRLEYMLPNPLLSSITLVDTPGWGPVVEEHEARSAEFLGLARRLRERHDAETRRIHETADAIVHLVGAVARNDDRELLEQFAGAT